MSSPKQVAVIELSEHSSVWPCNHAHTVVYWFIVSKWYCRHRTCCYWVHTSRLVSTQSNDPSVTSLHDYVCSPVFRCVLSVRRVSGDGPGGPRELGLWSPLAASSLQRYQCDFVQKSKGRVRLGIHKITTKWRRDLNRPCPFFLIWEVFKTKKKRYKVWFFFFSNFSLLVSYVRITLLGYRYIVKQMEKVLPGGMICQRCMGKTQRPVWKQPNWQFKHLMNI